MNPSVPVAAKFTEEKEEKAIPHESLAGGIAKLKIKESNHVSTIPRFEMMDINSNVKMEVLVDSGSETSLINKDLVTERNLKTEKCSPITMITANGSTEDINERVSINMNNTGEIYAKCAPLRKGLNVILGYDWMRTVNAKMNYDAKRLEFTLTCGKTSEIRAKNEINDVLMTKKRLKKEFRRKEIDEVFMVEFANVNIELNVTEKSERKLMDTKLKEVIESFPGVYPEQAKLTGLPEARKRLKNPAMIIDTGDATPRKSRYYNMGADDLEELKRQLKVLIDSKLIRPSQSPWGSPVLFVKKKNGSKRLVIDYRKVNAITRSDSYPLPRIQDNLDQLGGAKIFTTLDATSGFHQNPLHEDDIPKTAFHTRYGSYEFMVTPFGLKNSPSAFQRLMNEVLGELLDKCCVCYMDDILIYSRDLEEHIKHVEMVSKRLEEYGIQINMNKSKFAQNEVLYCGFKIKEGITTVDPAKISVITEWPVPQNVSAVRSFLGFVGYYRRYICNFSGIAAPLTDLTKKNSPWKWTILEQTAFNRLREALISAPVLRTPDSSKAFVIVVDAGPKAVGGILMQEFDDGMHPIAYEYHRLTTTEEKYSQYEREFLGLLNGLRKWRHYFQGKKLIVKTDNKGIVQLLRTMNDPHYRIARWLEEYEMWSPDIEFVSGKENIADIPSRLDIPYLNDLPISDYEVDRGLEVNVILRSDTLDMDIDEDLDWPLFIAHYLLEDCWLENMSESVIEKCKKELENFTFKDDKFMRICTNKLDMVHYLPAKDRSETMKRFHDGLGHLKYASVIDLLKRRFWWSGMDRDFKEFISSCERCQLDSSSNSVFSKPLPRPLPSVGIPFERWGIDSVGPLTETKRGNKHIITAIDYATRWVVAKPVKTVSDETIASFLYGLIIQYGSPYELISDRAKVNLSKSIKNFESKNRIKHLASTPYHPQTNGMVERMHSMLGHALTTLTNGKSERWDEYLPQTLFALRTRTHAVTKYSPFYLLYGVHPRLPGDTDPPRSDMMPLDEVERMEERNEFVARNMDELGLARGAAYLRSKAQAERIIRKHNLDENSSDYYFKPGDWVKMKNHNYSKFEYDWKGPYMIDQIGFPGTYWIKKPNGERLESTVNQSELAPWLSRTQPNRSFFYEGSAANS